MVGIDDIVITGLGCITPIGHGRHAFWQGLSTGKCGTREIFCSRSGDRVRYGGIIRDFDGKQYVVPRKALKLMSHEVQISYAAAHLAWEDAGLVSNVIEPDRVGVVFGSELIPGDPGDMIPAVRSCSNGSHMDSSRWGTEFSKAIYPLWLLRNLPNMPPCHVAIAVDARGPNNTIAQEEVSGLLALGEAINIMQRGDADVMIVGAMGCRVNATRLAYHVPGFYMEGRREANLATESIAGSSWSVITSPESELSLDGPASSGCFASHSRAFDASRAGIVPSEAAVVLVLEKRRHAVARSANLYGTVLATSSRCGRPHSLRGGSTTAISNAAQSVLRDAGLTSKDIACVSAQGYSHSALDKTEAAAIQQIADQCPVSAYSSYYGTAGAASGLLQLASGLLATGAGRILPILGYSTPDAGCSVNVCRREQSTSSPYLMQLSFTMQGQAAATIVDCLPTR